MKLLLISDLMFCTKTCRVEQGVIVLPHAKFLLQLGKFSLRYAVWHASICILGI